MFNKNIIVENGANGFVSPSLSQDANEIKEINAAAVGNTDNDTKEGTYTIDFSNNSLPYDLDGESLW